MIDSIRDKRKNKTEFLTIRVSKEEKQVIKKYCKENKIKLKEFSKWLKDNQDWINK